MRAGGAMFTQIAFNKPNNKVANPNAITKLFSSDGLIRPP